jgi:tRNA pseudouridine(38-40) synthase
VPTLLLSIAYDGSNYSGWQAQPNGLAVQQVVEDALEQLLKERVQVRSSGRTDAGVHALAMAASFTTTKIYRYGLLLKVLTGFFLLILLSRMPHCT